MTSKKKIVHKDEVDIFQIINIIWNYKIPILFIITVSMLSGIGMNFSKITNTKYLITVPYSILYHSTRVKDLCNKELSCINLHSSDNIIRLLDEKWNYDLKNNTIFFTSQLPFNREEISNKLNEVNKILTNEILEAAKYDLYQIENGLKSSLMENNLSAEITEHYLETKRIIYSIDNGKKAIYFGDLNINKIDNKVFRILISSLIIGTIIAFMYVTFKVAIIQQKKA